MKLRWKWLSLVLAGLLATSNIGLLGELVWAQSPLAQAPEESDRGEASSSEEFPPLPDAPEEVEAPAEPDASLETPVPEDNSEAEGTDSAGSDESTTDAPTEVIGDEAVSDEAVQPSPEELARQQLLIEADRLFLAGDRTAAVQLYRQAKEPLPEGEAALELPEPVLSADNLSPAAAVYWREAEAGAELGLETRILVPLQLLVEQYPEFIPGHIRYAQALIEYDRSEEAIPVMSAAATRYPAQPDLLMAQVEVLMHAEQWIEASIAARQFAVLNPRHPEHDAMLELANTNLDRFRRELRQDLQGNVIGNIVTGALGYALTGGLFGPFSALDSTLLLLRGESGMGDRIAEQAREQLPVVSDPEVTAYINGLGQRLARVAGRDEFDYEFYVVLDDRLNAFALPGGKIFINAGAILKTESAAELAGLLAHEISHAVLSHGFQLATEGNLAASLAQYIPVPAAANIATGLVVTGYSRQMERQADVMGTQILAASGYAADGLYRLMMTLDQEAEERAGLSWFATHPRTDDRVLYLAELVETGGYERFAYEGVEPHLEIQQRVTTLLKEYELQERLEEAQ